MLKSIEEYLLKIIVFIVSLQGMALVILIGTEVFFRYLVGHALSWPEEVAGVFFVWFTLLGVVLLTQSGEHIEFSFLAKRPGTTVGKAFTIFIQTVVVLYSLLMVVYGYSYALMFRFESTPAAGINSLWLNLSMPVCGLLIFFYSQLNIVKMLKPSEKNPASP
jgi:TRAP-type C4-dicarboxylate transport system permease small subunit